MIGYEGNVKTLRQSRQQRRRQLIRDLAIAVLFVLMCLVVFQLAGIGVE